MTTVHRKSPIGIAKPHSRAVGGGHPLPSGHPDAASSQNDDVGNRAAASGQAGTFRYGDLSDSNTRRTEMLCYWKRRRGISWADIGERFFPDAGSIQLGILRASAAASRYAVRSGEPWPLGAM
jgi:hypothetical protein